MDSEHHQHKVLHAERQQQVVQLTLHYESMTPLFSLKWHGLKEINGQLWWAVLGLVLDR